MITRILERNKQDNEILVKFINAANGKGRFPKKEYADRLNTLILLAQHKNKDNKEKSEHLEALRLTLKKQYYAVY